MVLSGGVVGTETGSMRWMGDGSTLSMEIVIGWENGEDSRLAVVFLHRDMRIFWSWFRVWVLSGVLALFSTVGDFFVLLSIKELTLVRRVRIRMEAGPALRVLSQLDMTASSANPISEGFGF
ncbi:hypothetical protein Bca101_097097 [Brassica carinata]